MAESIGSATFRYLEPFFVIGAVYRVINTLLSIGQGVLERRMGRAYAMNMPLQVQGIRKRFGAVIREPASDGMTMVIVTHETGFAREVADRIVFMDGGVIVEEAKPEDFFTRPSHARARSFLRLVEHQGPVPSPPTQVRHPGLHTEGA